MKFQEEIDGDVEHIATTDEESGQAEPKNKWVDNFEEKEKARREAEIVYKKKEGPAERFR